MEVPAARSVAAFAVLLLLLVAPAVAQWSSDPALNLVVADRVQGETLPLIGSTSDGGVYIAWFDDSTGSFRVFLQRLDAAGAEQWAHNGVLISDKPQDTALFGWDMIVDSADHAVIVFSDLRDGGDLDIHAYRVDPTGAQVWGANGVTLSNNPDFEPAPRVAEASNGDLVFVWARLPSGSNGDIRMQRVSPAGMPLLAPGGIPVASGLNESPGFVQVVASDGGSVILSWLRDIDNFLALRHIRAQKFSSTGASSWGGPVSVYDAFSVPIGYFPQFLADGAGGALSVWHRSDGAFFNSFVQRLDASGTKLFPHNGIAVSTVPNMYHINPSGSYDPTTQETIVFWNEQNSLQSTFGLYAQKFSAAGARMWGSGGTTLIAVGSTPLSPPHSVRSEDGAMVFLLDSPGVSTDRLLGLRVDGSGASLWGAAPTVLSSSPGTKSRYPVTIGDGIAKLAWEDFRSGSGDIYAQNVNPDGTLGLSVAPGTLVDDIVLDKSASTPGDLNIRWTASCSLGAQDYAIYEGLLGAFYSHVRRDCSDDGGDLMEELRPGPGNRYYLVVPLTAAAEGSYGKDTDGFERPAASPGNSCRALQDLGGCPP